MKTCIAWASLAAGLALSPTPTLAAPAVACNPEGTQLELNACASEEYAAADAALNAAWRDLLAALEGQPTAIARLREAQRAWIAFRDAEIAARFPVEDGEDPRMAYGSMYPMALNAALTTLTRARTAELRARLDEINDR